MITSDWVFNGQLFTEDMIGGSFGFVYLITNIMTKRKYVGKKLFTAAARKMVKGKSKKIRKSSNWKNYWGSSKTVQEDVKNMGDKCFTREILRLCRSRSECTYYETVEIIERKALETDEYYNEWLQCRISKKHIKKA